MPIDRIDLKGLTAAVCAGVVEGNKPLVAALIDVRDKKHDLRERVQDNADKAWEIDGELKLVKGVMVTLVGNGDGSTGMVPRLERDMGSMGNQISEVRNDMAALKAQVQNLSGTLGQINENIKALSAGQAQQKSWTDGWKGVGVAIGIISACLSVVAVMVSAIVWLFTHGIKP